MSRLRRAFTLIELLAVIAIIALLSALVLGLTPGNPKGIAGATRQVESLVTLARSQAMLANIDDPADPNGTNKYATVRSRLIILKDKTDPQNHLRRCGIILGAQVLPGGAGTPKTEATVRESDLQWFAVSEPIMLPPGVYYARNDLTALREILRSDAQSQSFPAARTMRIEFPRRGAQPTQGGSKEWYYYEFMADGSCNTRDLQSSTDTTGSVGTGARLMVVEGDLAPDAENPVPKNKEVVGGIIITPRGKTLAVTNLYEQQR